MSFKVRIASADRERDKNWSTTEGSRYASVEVLFCEGDPCEGDTRALFLALSSPSIRTPPAAGSLSLPEGGCGVQLTLRPLDLSLVPKPFGTTPAAGSLWRREVLAGCSNGLRPNREVGDVAKLSSECVGLVDTLSLLSTSSFDDFSCLPICSLRTSAACLALAFRWFCLDTLIEFVVTTTLCSSRCDE